MAEMRDYYATPSSLRLRVLRAFERLVPEVFAGSKYVTLDMASSPIWSDDFDRFLQSKATVFSFFLTDAAGQRLGLDALQNVFRWLADDMSGLLDDAPLEARRDLATRLHIGQPVMLGRDGSGPAVLRLALGGVMVSRVAQDPAWGERFDDRVHWVEDRLVSLKRKLEVITANYPTLLHREQTRPAAA